MLDSCIKLIGYDMLGISGSEGLRYAWKHKSSQYYVESAAFVQRSKMVKDNVSGYTTSVSAGCILQSMHLACKFCRTGTLLPFGEKLTPFEIAKQNVFMVLSDMNCSNHINLGKNAREFAYMGQGEPGFSYDQVRKAIQLTDVAMRELGQSVFRHIIATSGVPQMIQRYIEDLNNGFFKSRTTLHFSLHGTKCRSNIMPIDTLYSYKDSLNLLSEISSICGEKPCVGILLLNNFRPVGSDKIYSMDFNAISEILEELNPSKVRLSFCEFNGSQDLGRFDDYDEAQSNQIMEYAQARGFEAKLFSSFGKKEITACGMLGGREPQKYPSQKWIELEGRAEEIVAHANNLLSLGG